MRLSPPGSQVAGESAVEQNLEKFVEFIITFFFCTIENRKKSHLARELILLCLIPVVPLVFLYS